MVAFTVMVWAESAWARSDPAPLALQSAAAMPPTVSTIVAIAVIVLRFQDIALASQLGCRRNGSAYAAAARRRTCVIRRG